MILRRSQAQIYLDILTSVQRKNGKIKKTHIMYDANLTHNRLEKYLGILFLNKFLEKNDDKNQTFYKITKKGYEFLAEIRRLKKMSEAFGISV